MYYLVTKAWVVPADKGTEALRYTNTEEPEFITVDELTPADAAILSDSPDDRFVWGATTD